MRESCAFESEVGCAVMLGAQLEYDGDFKIYREDGISRYGKTGLFIFVFSYGVLCCA